MHTCNIHLKKGFYESNTSQINLIHRLIYLQSVLLTFVFMNICASSVSLNMLKGDVKQRSASFIGYTV